MRERNKAFSERQSQHWMRAGSILIGFAALTLLVSAFGAHLYSGLVSSALLTVVLVALGVAICLHVRFLLLARREHRDTAKALDATEREYKSVFDSTLDGILILEDQGVCVDANPAALSLLGTDHDELVGHSIEPFFAGSASDGFQESWKRFLNRTYDHRETRLLRGDARTVFVEYTARANFLPGRHVIVLRDISQRRQAEAALRESEERFRQMASNIQEVFWMLDAETMQVLYVNPAYEAITGRSCESLRRNPKSYEEVIHHEDRIHVLSRLKESVRTGQFNEEFRIVRPGNTIHWVWVRGFPVRDAEGIVRRLVGTAQDVTARKLAESQIARNLDLAEAARAEAEAFRKTSLALTQDLSMDYVLDTLLQSLLELIPCEAAQVILAETDTRLFLAREIQNCRSNRPLPRSPATFDARENPFLVQVLATQDSLLLCDAAQEAEWLQLKGFSHLRSWLCVPLLASQHLLGLLSLGDMRAHAFTKEHLRLAKSLAIPAAVAIQNARLYEQAEIFRSELEQRLADLQQADEALTKSRRPLS